MNAVPRGPVPRRIESTTVSDTPLSATPSTAALDSLSDPVFVFDGGDRVQFGNYAANDAPNATLVADADATVLVDDCRLQHLLTDIFRNAVEHGSTGPGSRTGEDPGGRNGGEVSVTVEPLEDGFAVSDDSDGIPHEDREEVFDAGFSTSRDGTASG